MAEAATQEQDYGALATERSDRHIASGWYGMWWLVITEGALFAYLIFSYLYTLLQAGQGWPPGGPPSLKLALPNTILLIGSSVVIWFGERAGRRGRHGLELALVVVTILMGAIFVGIQFKEWSDKPFSYDTHLYGSFYFTVTAFHMATWSPGSSDSRCWRSGWVSPAGRRSGRPSGSISGRCRLGRSIGTSWTSSGW